LGLGFLLFETFFPPLSLILFPLFMFCWLGFQMVFLVFKGASLQITSDVLRIELPCLMLNPKMIFWARAFFFIFVSIPFWEFV
jgi:hypothetical protein